MCASVLMLVCKWWFRLGVLEFCSVGLLERVLVEYFVSVVVFNVGSVGGSVVVAGGRSVAW